MISSGLICFIFCFVFCVLVVESKSKPATKANSVTEAQTAEMCTDETTPLAYKLASKLSKEIFAGVCLITEPVRTDMVNKALYCINQKQPKLGECIQGWEDSVSRLVQTEQMCKDNTTPLAAQLVSTWSKEIFEGVCTIDEPKRTLTVFEMLECVNQKQPKLGECVEAWEKNINNLSKV